MDCFMGYFGKNNTLMEPPALSKRQGIKPRGFHADTAKLCCLQMRSVKRIGEIADQQTTAACTGNILTASVHQIGIEHENIARVA